MEVQGQLITVIGGAYFQPIADMMDRLRSWAAPGQGSEFKVAPFENGYAASICILAVVAFESFLMRVSYFKQPAKTQEKPGKTTKTDKWSKPAALKTFEEIYPKYPKLGEVKEAFAVRDLLAHNHIWEIDYYWKNDDSPQLLQALRKLGGDSKYMKVVDPGDPRFTRRLRLNVVPTRVDRRDAAKVLITVWEALEYIENDDRAACPVSESHVRRANKSVEFAMLLRDFYRAT